jgi:CRP-like cAMP-binding protein
VIHGISTTTAIHVIGYVSAALGILMLAMQTMIPLRITGLAHNVGQIAFGLLSGVYPLVIQHTILLPINLRRLLQMRRLIRQVKDAAVSGSNSLEWLAPFMDERDVHKGQVLVRAGETADRMFYVLSGRFNVSGINVDIGAGAMVGELGMLAPDQKRSHTVVCTEDAKLLVLPYSRIEQLYYQNPAFGFYFLKLSSARLFDNNHRLEQQLAEREAEIATLRSKLTPEPKPGSKQAPKPQMRPGR